jgi:CDP-diacylglycerol---serine O-phosphatidyltransferase
VSKSLLLIRLIPNLITFAAIAVGFGALRFALDGSWEKAVWCVILADILDMLDGRVARFFKVTSSFGVELDSLADLINFGAVPALIIYLWSVPLVSSKSVKFLLWSAGSFYLICTAIRLAKFNLLAHNIKSEKGIRYFFFGVPSSVGAILALIPVMWDFDLASHFNYHLQGSIFVVPHLILVGVLMASRIPTFSLKFIRISQEYIWILLISFAILIFSLILYPWYLLPICTGLYLVSIVFSVLFFERLKGK